MRLEPDRTPPDQRGWIVVAALFVVAVFSWGIAFYGLGFYLRELQALRGWSLTGLSWVTFIFYVVSAGLNFSVGHRLGAGQARRVFLLGAVSLAVSLAAIGQVTSFAGLIVAYLVMALGWSCLSITAISAVVMGWFGPRSGAPLTVALTGASVGGAVLIPVLDSLRRWLGFQNSLLLLAVVELLVVGLLAVTVIREPPGRTRTGPSPERHPAAWSVLSRPEFWPLAVALAIGLLVQVGFLVHQLSILSDTITGAPAARIVALTTIAALAGRIVFIAATRHAPAAAPGALFLMVQAVALMVLASSGRGLAASALCSVAFGAGVGVLVVIAPLLTSATFPDLEFTAVFPVVAIGYQLTMATGAPLVALGHDRLGGYAPTLWLLGAGDAVAAALLGLNWWSSRAQGRAKGAEPSAQGGRSSLEGDATAVRPRR